MNEDVGRFEESPKRRYQLLLDSYQRLEQKISQLLKKTFIPNEPETMYELIKLENQRHSIHLELEDIAKSLGKTKEDVLLDIMREKRTLTSAGLPEFSFLLPEGVLYTGDFHNPIRFNLGSSAGPVYNEYTESEGDFVIPRDCVLLVYAIVPIRWPNYNQEIEEEPWDYEIRLRRAKELLKKVNGRFFEKRNSNFHSANVKVMGVVLPKENFLEILQQIKKNKLLRIGDQFYTQSDLAYNRFAKMAREESHAINKVEPPKKKINKNRKLDLPKLETNVTRPEPIEVPQNSLKIELQRNLKDEEFVSAVRDAKDWSSFFKILKNVKTIEFRGFRYNFEYFIECYRYLQSFPLRASDLKLPEIKGIRDKFIELSKKRRKEMGEVVGRVLSNSRSRERLIANIKNLYSSGYKIYKSEYEDYDENEILSIIEEALDNNYGDLRHQIQKVPFNHDLYFIVLDIKRRQREKSR